LGLLAMGFWLLGHGVMVALTLRDPHWDEVLIAQCVHGYKAYYEAG
jgi:type IV secretory pathway TrbD component